VLEARVKRSERCESEPSVVFERMGRECVCIIMGDSVGLKGPLTVYFGRVWCPRGSNSLKTSLGVLVRISLLSWPV
jgi:hypothetical protein